MEGHKAGMRRKYRAGCYQAFVVGWGHVPGDLIGGGCEAHLEMIRMVGGSSEMIVAGGPWEYCFWAKEQGRAWVQKTVSQTEVLQTTASAAHKGKFKRGRRTHHKRSISFQLCLFIYSNHFNKAIFRFEQKLFLGVFSFLKLVLMSSFSKCCDDWTGHFRYNMKEEHYPHVLVLRFMFSTAVNA